MPYTFGAVTSDDITFLAPTTISGTNRVHLVTGWWRPTTLTAGKGLWTAGNQGRLGAEIAPTTSELRLKSTNTVDGSWTTTDVGLTVDEWKFIAIMFSTSNVGPAIAWRVWAGTVETAPQSVTVTLDTTPEGNFVGNANVYIGNNGTGNSAFEGDIADWTLAYSSSVPQLPTIHPFGVAAIGTITDAEALHVYETMVVPLWLGDVSTVMRRQGDRFEVLHVGLDGGGVVVASNKELSFSSTISPNINGATWSQNGAPRPYSGMDMLPRPRR